LSRAAAQISAAKRTAFNLCWPRVVPVLPPTGAAGVGSLKPFDGRAKTAIVTRELRDSRTRVGAADSNSGSGPAGDSGREHSKAVEPAGSRRSAETEADAPRRAADDMPFSWRTTAAPRSPSVVRGRGRVPPRRARGHHGASLPTRRRHGPAI